MFEATPIHCRAASNSGYEKRTVHAEFDDSTASELSVLIHGNNAYLKAEEIAKAFGMSYAEDKKTASLYTRSNDVTSCKLSQFHIGSNKVNHLILKNLIEYEAPADCIAYDDAVWIPFEYSLLLLDSGYVILDDMILIDKPRDTIWSIFNNVSKNIERYSFTYQDDFGYTDSEVAIIGGTNHLVNVFSGLLDFDGAAWLEMFRGISKIELNPTEIPSEYDVKYGEKLATLFCTYSDSELKEECEKIKKAQSVLSPNGALGKYLVKKEKLYDKEIGNASKNLQECVSECYPTDTITISKAKNALDDVINKSNTFSESTSTLRSIQNSLSDVTSFLDTAMTIAEVVGYLEEFKNKDNFSISALNDYLSIDNELSPMLKTNLQANAALFQTNPVIYSAERVLTSKIPSWIGKGISITEAVAAEPMLLAWNLASSFIPFISDGLSSADKYELSLYASWLASSSFTKYMEQKDKVYSAKENKSKDCYELSKLCYVFLKSSIITRSAALGSLENTKNFIPNEVAQIEKVQNDINNDIAKLLVELEKATANNERFEYGFLPEDSEKYKALYDGKILVNKIRDIKEYEKSKNTSSINNNKKDSSKININEVDTIQVEQEDIQYFDSFDAHTEKLYNAFFACEWSVIRDILESFNIQKEKKMVVYSTPIKDTFLVLECLPKTSWKAYLGEFSEGKRNGNGVMVSKGYWYYNVYCGMWKDNYPNGNGVLLNSLSDDSFVFSGLFSDGKFDSTINAYQLDELIDNNFSIDYQTWEPIYYCNGLCFNELNFSNGKPTPLNRNDVDNTIAISEQTERELEWLNLEYDGQYYYRSMGDDVYYVLSVGSQPPQDGYRGSVRLIMGTLLNLFSDKEATYGVGCYASMQCTF